MSEALLTPIDLGPVVDLAGGKLFRKQILPKGSINYQGQKLDFTPMLPNLVKAFKDKAYPQVSFIYADDQNRHNMDPERWRGELVGVELTDDGLDGVFQLNDQAATLVDQNPRLGVSARIVMDYERADGKKWSHALQHVLATLDPKVPNMRPWEAVNLSNGDGLPVLDLSGLAYEGEEMPKGTEQEWTETDLADFLNSLDDDTEQPEGDEPEGDEGEAEGENTTEGEELEEDDFEPAGELAGASLSNKLDLAGNAQFVQLSNELAEVRGQLARTRWESERHSLLQDGVPPHLLDLATPVMERDGEQAVELSNGRKVTASSVVRAMLNASKGFVDLTGASGTSYDTGTRNDPDQKLLEQWSAEYGD